MSDQLIGTVLLVLAGIGVIGLALSASKRIVASMRRKR